MLSSDDVETHTREGGFDLCGIAPAEAFPELRFTPRNCTAQRLAVTKIACQECEREFETLVRTGEIPECPSCHGSNLQQRLPVFAAHTSGAASTALPTASACGVSAAGL